MKQGITLEQAIRIATYRTVPLGFKPEDYLCVNESIPIKLAQLIVKEALHLVKISQYYWTPDGSEADLL